MRKPVLTIFYHFNPWGISVGGIETLIRTWIRHAPDSFEVRIVGVGSPGEVHGIWRDTELDGRPLKFFSAYGCDDLTKKRATPHTLRFAWALARAGQGLASDFMHFHRIEPTIAAFHWKGDKTLFFHIDIEKQLTVDRSGNEFGWRRWPAAYFALERSLIARFDRVLECNTASLEFHRSAYPALADRFELVRNCVDTTVHTPLPMPVRTERRARLAASLGLPPTTAFLLFAGRLQPMKNPLLLLKAFAALNRPGVHLLIAGDGNLRPDVVKAIAESRLQGRVSMCGALGRETLLELQQVSDAFVMTSTFEGLPVAALEALACGIPVVTTRCGDLPNLLTRQSGVVCDEMTPKCVAAALGHVLDNPEAYPVSACTGVVTSHTAQIVLKDAYDKMLADWYADTCDQISYRGSPS